MRRLLLLLFFLLPLLAQALTIAKGDIYFDNSLTQYELPKFVYGNDSKSYVVAMKQEKGNIWKVTMTEQVTGMTKYFFSNTAMSEGVYDLSISTVKDDIASGTSPKENRTASRSDDIQAGKIFIPSSSDSNNWWPGDWSDYGESGAVVSGTEPSGTLPVLFITTSAAQSTVTKDAYITGTYYLDNMGSERYESIGDKDNQLGLQIKGRGNYTWSSFDKKPYRLKLDEKQKLMGMSSGRHWAILAHADDSYSYLKNTVGFELSRRMGLPWTPGQEPIEVVWNGTYQGLYMLTETIRVGKKRVNITEQPDMSEATDSITGGWLVEIDNYSDTPQINVSGMNVTGHSPELWSFLQRSYLTAQMNAIHTAVYNQNWTNVQNYIDFDAAARFYVVNEIMDNEEAYNGSCFLYKDMDKAGEPLQKWKFGPVWDFGNCFTNSDIYDPKHIATDHKFSAHLIESLYYCPAFMESVKEQWKIFKGNHYEGLDAFVDDFISQISAAAKNDGARWPQYNHSDVSASKSKFMDYLSRRINWLVAEWGEGEVLDGVESATSTLEDAPAAIYSLSGQRISKPSQGVYIIRTHEGTRKIMVK